MPDLRFDVSGTETTTLHVASAVSERDAGERYQTCEPSKVVFTVPVKNPHSRTDMTPDSPKTANALGKIPIGRRGGTRVSQTNCGVQFPIRRPWDRDDYFARRISRGCTGRGQTLSDQ